MTTVLESDITREDVIQLAACVECCAHIGEQCSFPKGDPHARTKYRNKISHGRRVAQARANFLELINDLS